MISARDRSRDFTDAGKAKRLFGGIPGRHTLDETHKRRDTEVGQRESLEQRALYALEGGAYLSEVVGHLVQDREDHREAIVALTDWRERQIERLANLERRLGWVTLAAVGLALLLTISVLFQTADVRGRYALAARVSRVEIAAAKAETALRRIEEEHNVGPQR